jgi:uncharacterized protein DUF4242
MVERYVSGKPDDELERIAASLRAAVRELKAEGVPVHYLRSTLIAGDESCLCFFEAESAAVVRRVNHRAGLPYLRIVAAKSALGNGDAIGKHAGEEERVR